MHSISLAITSTCTGVVCRRPSNNRLLWRICNNRRLLSLNRDYNTNNKNNNSNNTTRRRHFSTSHHQVIGAKNVHLSYGNNDQHSILEDVDFSIQEGAKVTIMGQNGAGKSSIIKLLNKSLRPDEGQIIVRPGEKIATAMQTMPMASRELTVEQFFLEQLNNMNTQQKQKQQLELELEQHELDAKMSKALNAVLLDITNPEERIIKSFSGGQQARLLLAAALIQGT